MRKLLVAFVLSLTAAVVTCAAPGGTMHCGKLLDVRTGQLLADQIVTFNAEGIINSVGPATSAPASAYAIDL